MAASLAPPPKNRARSPALVTGGYVTAGAGGLIVLGSLLYLWSSSLACWGGEDYGSDCETDKRKIVQDALFGGAIGLGVMATGAILIITGEQRVPVTAPAQGSARVTYRNPVPQIAVRVGPSGLWLRGEF